MYYVEDTYKLYGRTQRYRYVYCSIDNHVWNSGSGNILKPGSYGLSPEDCDIGDIIAPFSRILPMSFSEMG